MQRFKDKVALVTSDTGGLGMATAKLFLVEVAKVVIVDISKEALEKAIFEMDHENPSYSVADIAIAEDNKKFVEQTLEVYDKIDIFFANAGIEGTSKPIAEYSEAIFNKVIAVNLKGVWLGCQHVILKMKNGGSVMITSSVAGLKGFAGLGAYFARKHAVIDIMRVMALENADRRIRVNTIHLRSVNNNMMWRIEKNMSPENPEEVLKGFEATVSFGRYAESSEIDDMALFLASDDSQYITGCSHVVNGGMFMA